MEDKTQRMVFYDQSRFRMRLFRAFSIFIFCATLFIFVFALIDLFSNLVAEKRGLNTIRYYNYYQQGDHNHKKITLTFDDGPDPLYTRRLLEILDQYKIKATFFFIGEETLFHPKLIREVHDRGHEIGNHTFTHSEDVHLSDNRLQWELGLTGYFLTVITGDPPIYYRPPYLLDIGGDPTLNPYVLRNKVLDLSVSYNYVPIGTDIDSKDWKASNAEEIVARIEDGVDSGHIILLHDGGNHNVALMLEALPIVIEKLQAKGYSFVSLDDLLFPKGASPERLVRFGDRDQGGARDVLALQEFLRYEGYLDSGYIPGEFDYPTAFSLLEWKAAHGLINSQPTVALEEASLDSESLELMKKFSADPRTILNFSNPSGFWEKISRDVGRIIIFSFSSLVDILFFILIGVTSIIGARVLLIIFLFFYKKYIFKSKSSLSYAGNISVIIPAYNEEDNIKATILSVIRNTYKTDDIIVIDDGSKDNTAREVQSLIDKYPGLIRLISKDNGGKATALNVGIAEVKHPIIVTIDGDTILSKTAVEKLISPFIDSEVGAVAGTVLTASGTHLLDLFQRIEYVTGQYLEKYALDLFGAIGVVPGPIGAWRKETLKKAGGYSFSTIVEDQDMTLAVHVAGYRVAYVKEAIAHAETPFKIKDFVKQRFRWVFGTYQCFWKYKKFIGRRNVSFGLGFIILPNTALFGFVLPVFFPVMDILFIGGILFGPSLPLIVGYLIFTLLDCLYASFALFQDKKYRPLIFLVPFQRLFYRAIMFYVIIKSYVKAIEGTYAFWNKVARNGQAQDLFEKETDDREEILIGRA